MNSRQTEFPTIFEKTYWGCGSKGTDEIFANRNQFIRDYDIVSVQSDRKIQNQKIFEYIQRKKTGRFHPYLDHVEWYFTRDERFIVISSPFNKDDILKHIENGWNQIPILYTGATTFMISFTKDDLKHKLDKVTRRYKREVKELNRKWKTTKGYSNERHRQMEFIEKHTCITCQKEYEDCVC